MLLLAPVLNLAAVWFVDTFSSSWKDAGRCCYQKYIPVVITNKISPPLPTKSWLPLHSARSVIPHHAPKWEKKLWSVKSWKSALYFGKSLIWVRWSPVFPKCHCGLVCLTVSFSCEWRQLSLVLCAVFISESSKGACLLSKHQERVPCRIITL